MQEGQTEKGREREKRERKREQGGRRAREGSRLAGQDPGRSALSVPLAARVRRGARLHQVGAEGVLREVLARVLGHQLLDEGEEPARRAPHPPMQLRARTHHRLHHRRVTPADMKPH